MHYRGPVCYADAEASEPFDFPISQRKTDDLKLVRRMVAS